MYQLRLDLQEPPQRRVRGPYRDTLQRLLTNNLDFHRQDSGYASHDFHAFPAKFPPQLPRLFIEGLTHPGDVVLDPMMGSGTTVVEAFLGERHAVGSDIDPMAVRLCQTKTTPLPLDTVAQAGYSVLERATRVVQNKASHLSIQFDTRFDPKTRSFIKYWFRPETQQELLALILEIEQIPERDIRAFLELAFSAIIITKSGGVSLARDLAHTRPHRVVGKPVRSALNEFRRRLKGNLTSLADLHIGTGKTTLFYGDAQRLAIEDASVDLIVTSPPYASNAIDYMRAHKFSLVWLGYSIEILSTLRREYIGGEATQFFVFEDLPSRTAQAVHHIAQRDSKKGRVLHRYYSEMTRCLREMFRVLKPDRGAVIVVGTSTMRGMDTRTQDCLVEIGEDLGFEVVDVVVRQLDRDRRMMPARRSAQPGSLIEERMYNEYVVGFYKPANTIRGRQKR